MNDLCFMYFHSAIPDQLFAFDFCFRTLRLKPLNITPMNFYQLFDSDEIYTLHQYTEAFEDVEVSFFYC